MLAFIVFHVLLLAFGYGFLDKGKNIIVQCISSEKLSFIQIFAYKEKK